ncbi:ABC transporter [alpha proteobacterium U9-1i]|nr:ABC transporter [alpha proteobacterium U9-1i]
MSADGPFQETPRVRVEALAIARGGRVLFDGLSFEAAPSALVEIVGPNGAGKTSLLRAIAGFLRPHAGRIVLDGASESALAQHFVAHQNGLKPSISVRAHLRYWAGLLGGAGDERAALERVGLARAADLPARVLSQGQARRLALSRLLLARRPVWLLDEPAAALDAAGRALLSDLIEAHRAQGGVVLAAVHEPLVPTPSARVEVGA